MAKVYGKAILFGEHFVAYGGKAIVSSIPLSLVINLENVSSLQQSSVILNGVSFHNTTTEKIIDRIFLLLSVKDSFIISVSSEIPIASGLGSSSAFIVCLLKTLNEYYDLGMNLSQINSKAFSVEKEISSIISGIDNTIITYGGTMLFQQGSHQNIQLKKPITFLLVDSGIQSFTPDVLKKTRDNIQHHPQMFNSFIDENNRLVDKAFDALLKGDLCSIGNLMNRNHTLLKQLGVSHPHIEEILSLARSQSAYGGKVTGAGYGGFVIVVAEDYEKLIRCLSDHGYHSKLITIGKNIIGENRSSVSL